MNHATTMNKDESNGSPTNKVTLAYYSYCTRTGKICGSC
jgi:hypothetical protein